MTKNQSPESIERLLKNLLDTQEAIAEEVVEISVQIAQLDGFTDQADRVADAVTENAEWVTKKVLELDADFSGKLEAVGNDLDNSLHEVARQLSDLDVELTDKFDIILDDGLYGISVTLDKLERFAEHSVDKIDDMEQRLAMIEQSLAENTEYLKALYTSMAALRMPTSAASSSSPASPYNAVREKKSVSKAAA
jgi:hypothetical protein